MTQPMPTDGHTRSSKPAKANASETTRPLLVPNGHAREELGGISRETLRLLINAGEIETVMIGRRRLIVSDSLRALVARRASKAS